MAGFQRDPQREDLAYFAYRPWRFVSGSRHTRKKGNNSGTAGATFARRTVTRARSRVRGSVPGDRAATSLTVAQSHWRLNRLMVISGVAFSFVLLVGANLTVTSFIRLSRVDHGFQAENVLFMDFEDNQLCYSPIPCPFQLPSPPILAQMHRLASMVEEFRILSSAIRRMISPAGKQHLPTVFIADPISPSAHQAGVGD